MFFLLLSPAALCSSKLWEHLAYAKALGKPVRVAVIEGAEVPEGMLAGIADLEIRRCDTRDDLERFVIEVVEGGRT